jgi:hypothetical protein
MTFFHARGLDFIDDSVKSGQVDGRPSLTITYTAASPVSDTELGYLTVVQGDQYYYWFLMFMPRTTSDVLLYRPVFESVLQSVHWVRK